MQDIYPSLDDDLSHWIVVFSNISVLSEEPVVAIDSPHFYSIRYIPAGNLDLEKRGNVTIHVSSCAVSIDTVL